MANTSSAKVTVTGKTKKEAEKKALQALQIIATRRRAEIDKFSVKKNSGFVMTKGGGFYLTFCSARFRHHGK
jgi:hypothetical protein